MADGLNRKLWVGGTFSLCVAYAWVLRMAAYGVKTPHLINRGGAALSAFGAILVIFQVLYEEKIEHSNNIDLLSNRSEDLSSLEKELAAKVATSRMTNRRLRRRTFVVCVATVLVFGEALHGFGDMLLDDRPEKSLSDVR